MPSIGDRNLQKNSGAVYAAGIGKIDFSITSPNFAALARLPGDSLAGPVRRSATGLLYRIRTAAPYRTGALQSGLIVAPGREKTATPGKIVNDIVFDAAKNDTFVKISKSGKRYYYPASQEYGFRIGRVRRKPGLYYMRNTSAAYFPEHVQAISAGLDKILEDI